MSFTNGRLISDIFFILTPISKGGVKSLTWLLQLKEKSSEDTPFENPQRWMGQNTFPILLLNDDFFTQYLFLNKKGVIW